MNEHERLFVSAFVDPSRRDRFFSFLAHPKTRKKFRNELFHRKSRFLGPECLIPVEGRQRSAADLYNILKKMGSPELCWIIGGRFDAQEIELKRALDQPEDGVIVSCVPRKIGIFKKRRRGVHYSLLKHANFSCAQ